MGKHIYILSPFKWANGDPFLKIQDPLCPPPPLVVHPKRAAVGSVGCSELVERITMPKRGRDGGKTPAAKRQRQLKALAAVINRSSGAMVSRRSRIMPPETKYFDTTTSATVAVAADWTGTEVPNVSYIQSDGTTVGAYTDSALLPSAIGAGYGQVNGNKYFLKQLRLKGEILPSIVSDSADVLPMQTVRLVLVMDTQPNGAQAQGEEVFTDLGSATQCQYSFLAMGAGSGGRFRILKDKMFRMQPAIAGTDGANTNSVARAGASYSMSYRPKKPIQVVLKANSSTPTVASLSNVNIFLLAHAGVSGTTSIVGSCRVYFQD